MAESKKYYWLKLKRDFFKRHDIRIVENMPNGKDYILFYLKLLVESIDHEGELRFSATIPYSEQMLATITNTNVDIVRAAMQIFQELDLIEILDDSTIYMMEVEKLIGAETDEHLRESNRIRQQRYRNNQKALRNVTVTLHRNAEKEIEIDKEIDSILYGENDLKQSIKEIIDYMNDKLGTNYKATTQKNIDLIKARLNEGFSVDDFKKVIDKKNMAWRNDCKMAKFLRPITLFSNKFESYLNEPENQKHNFKERQNDIDKDVLNKFDELMRTKDG